MSRPAPTLGNPQNTIEILNKYKFVFQKKYGQNFLIDSHVLEKIIRAAQITEDDFVVEIGPGIGTMTQYLAASARGGSGDRDRPGPDSHSSGYAQRI